MAQKDSAIEAPLTTFGTVKVKRFLNNDIRSKFVSMEAEVVGSSAPAVLLLEKTPFGEESCEKLFTDNTKLALSFKNDIYASYHATCSGTINDLKATVIYPATDKHIEKYMKQEFVVIRETGKIFKEITQPFLDTQQLSLQWVDNILEGKSEQDRVLLNDTDSQNGFMLLPDLKWDTRHLDNLYCLAIIRQKGVKSIRDLTPQHIPMLTNILQKCLDKIECEYGVGREKLLVYLHYQPSYYHLHIHFTRVGFEAPGMRCDRGHLLETVISNLELVPDYYEKATLVYSLKENDPLTEKFRQVGVIPDGKRGEKRKRDQEDGNGDC